MMLLDLQGLCMALEDHSAEHEWWFDPRSAEVELRSDYFDASEEESPSEAGLVLVQPIGSRDAYGDLADFVECVADRRARAMLERAISGRGAFRRFKDTLLEFPELREAWFRFHDVRMERRAIEWLRDQHLLSEADAAHELAARCDPELPAGNGGFDARAIASAVADDLRKLYAGRLRDVILFGSQARGDAGPESDIDLLVVLDEVSSRWEEIKRMSDLLGRHSLDNDTVVVEIPVSEQEWRQARSPILIRARDEGFSIA